jgi:hypothetical protein
LEICAETGLSASGLKLEPKLGKKTMRQLRVLLPVVALGAGLWAQTADKPLTNSEVESMLMAGVPESTIVMKIQEAVFGGLVALDASSTALIALKQKGASEQILNAVVWAEPFGAGRKRQQEVDRAAPGLPGSAGVYYRESSGWVRLRSFLVWPPFYSNWNAPFRRSRQFNVPLSGTRADLQIRDRQPAFYLREPAAANGWQIIQVASRDDRRFLRFVSSGEFAAGDRFAASDARKVQVMHVADGVFKLQPAAPLEPGEYVVCTAVPGFASSSVCYGFGVQR